jgi:formate dehydrogenase subunit gamma
VKDNFPGKGDLRWLLTLGKDPNVGRFNVGEKLWFWGGLTLLGLVLTASGFVLDMLVPGIEYTRGNMQVANIIHLIGAVLFVAGSFGHIYMGTVGTEGAYQAMRNGYVDDTWAKEHHKLWYEQVERGEIPRVRTQEPTPTGGPAKAV